MLEDIFDLSNFNVFCDEENYYFFRALNNADNNDIETGITINALGEIERIRTNLERYEYTPKYNKDDSITLQEVFDHIKMHQSKDTNCISLTSNANTAITYGRGNYKDKYVLIKVPKHEIDVNVFEAGLFMMKEINKRISEIISNKEISDEQIKLLNLVDRINNNEQLEKIKQNLGINKDPVESFYAKGLVKKITKSKNYLSLNEKQNLEKNKLVLKLDIINKQILKGVSNDFLIQTLGNAFSSLELIHYKEIPKEKITIISKELVDILGLVQQLPEGIEHLEELKQELISKLQKIKLNGSYNYPNYQTSKQDFTLDNLYNLTQGRVDYEMAINLYRKAFYFAKSRLRTYNSINLLNKILNGNPKYNSLLEYMRNNTYGIEPEITTRLSLNKIQVSESVSLEFSIKEQKFFDYLKSLSIGQLNYIIKNPMETLKILLPIFIDEELDVRLQNKEDWYANSIIDLIVFERLGVTNNLSLSQRMDIVRTLKKHNFFEKYLELKNAGVDDKNIANVLITNLIREKDTINLNETFSLEELEYFVGYNRVKGTKLNLRSYQKLAVDNIDKTFETRQFTSAILPTGAGKSFVALAEMYKYRNEKILYLAPNKEILNQIKMYIKKIYNPEEHIGENENDVIKRIFPNLTLATYQSLKEESSLKMINEKYSLIVFDELHRTCAFQWQKRVNDLLDNQDEKVKVLGITATPERDADLKVTTDYWAHRYGYTDEEIIKGQHLAINMDIEEAIRLGYIVNPKIVNCEYSLMSDGSLEKIRLGIEENPTDELKYKYEKLRRNVINSDGIEKILGDNLKPDGKYIVFLPITKRDNGTYEDIDGNQVDKTTAERIIKSYQTLMKQFLYSNEFFNNNNKIIDIYNKIINNALLSSDEYYYLNQEKENILLLSKIDIQNKSQSLNTKNDLIIDTIIKYMSWEKLEEIELTKKINRKMKDKIEDYSMLGSYGDIKNANNLKGFNDSKVSKYRFMFVMNKLNEGVHVEDIDGIVWLRPLDANSRILYLQQLGRCIYSINPNKELIDNDRPLVIDLVNNTVKVDLKKGVDLEEKDLENLYLIKNWIDSYGEIPQFNSNDKVEKSYCLFLNNINKKYQKYKLNQDLLNEIGTKRKIIIEEIIKVGTSISLWDMPILDNLEYNSNNNQNKSYDITSAFEVNPVMRDFVELNNEVDNLGYIPKEEKLKILIETIQELQGLPQQKGGKVRTFADGTNIRIFYNGQILEKYQNLATISDLAERKWVEDAYNEVQQELINYSVSKDKKLKVLIETIQELQCLPQHIGNKVRTFADGTNIRNFYNAQILEKYQNLATISDLAERKWVEDAYNEVQQELTKYSMKLSKEEKLKLLIETIQELHSLPQKKDDKVRTFADGTNIRIFYNAQILKKYQNLVTISDPEERKWVKKAYNEVQQALIKYFVSKDKKLKILIKIIRELKELPQQIGNKSYKFDDGTNIRLFYNDQIVRKYQNLDTISDSEERKWVVKAYNEVQQELMKYSIDDSKKEKLKALIEIIQELQGLPQHKGDKARKFEDGTNVRSFYNDQILKKYQNLATISDLAERKWVENAYEEIQKLLDLYRLKKKNRYKSSKEEFDDISKFKEVTKSINSKEKENGKKIS